MFKVKFALYINENMVKTGATLKDISIAKDIPRSTLSYYAKGMVTEPNEEYCYRIANFFGDPPEVVDAMRRSAVSAQAEENKAVAEANDQALMERFIEAVNSNIVRLLTESRVDSDARYTARLDKVKAQYAELYDDQEAKHDKYVKHLLRIIRNLIIALVVIGAYAFYAYISFDLPDPTTGIHRDGHLHYGAIAIILAFFLADTLIAVKEARKNK